MVGHEKDRIINEVNSLGNNKIEFVVNDNYKNDVNILSLNLALKGC